MVLQAFDETLHRVVAIKLLAPQLATSSPNLDPSEGLAQPFMELPFRRMLEVNKSSRWKRRAMWPGRSVNSSTMGGRLAMEPEREGPIKAIVQLLSEEIDEVIRALREHLKETSPEQLKRAKGIARVEEDTLRPGVKNVRVVPGMTSKPPRTTKEQPMPGPNRPDLCDAPRAPMPMKVRPMLATPADRPFDRPGWVFEVKWEGYRAIAEVDKGRIRLYSGNGLSFTERYHPVAAALAKIPHRVVLDGELVVLDDKGHSNPEALQTYRSHRSTGKLVYQVFDILYLDGHDLRGLPLIRRKEILRQILPAVPGLAICDHVEEGGLAFFDAAAKAGVKGMIAKDGASKYIPGSRSDCWLKVRAEEHPRQRKPWWKFW
jgi:ATP-dependent DNA ligase